MCVYCVMYYVCVSVPWAGHVNHITGSSHGTSGVRAKTGRMNYNIISVSGGGRLGTLQKHAMVLSMISGSELQSSSPHVSKYMKLNVKVARRLEKVTSSWVEKCIRKRM